jgi:DNA repair exonuclease SbcCD nuclease subunit
MSNIKFIHAADLHLDTPFSGLSNLNQKLADRLKDATFASYKNIIDLAINKNVDFVVISGDIFDSENKSLSAQLKFVDQLKRLSEKNIPTYFICGNHDPLPSWLDSLDFPDQVYRFSSEKVGKDKFEIDGKTVAIQGISFATKKTTENLAKKFVNTNNTADLSVGLLHGTLGSSSKHEDYAPFSLDDVLDKDIDYWALGHIHQPQVIRKNNPNVIYSGNSQGRDFGETGQRGCVLVEAKSSSEIETEFKPTQEVRFERISVDLSNLENINSIPEQINERLEKLDSFDPGVSYMLRVNLTGKTHLHSQLNKEGKIEELVEFFNEGQLDQDNFCWVEQIKLNTKPNLDLNQIKQQNDFSAEVVKKLERLSEHNSQLEKKVEQINNEFNSKAKRELDKLNISDQKEILAQAKWKLLDQLLT